MKMLYQIIKKNVEMIIYVLSEHRMNFIFFGKKHFHKNPLYFRIVADFEADYEVDGSSVGNKTTNIYKQKRVLNGYYKISEMEDVLESGYYESPLGYDNVDWFVKDVIKLENKMAFYFKNTEKDTIITQEDKEDFHNNKFCRFCEKEILSDKVRDHCDLTGKNRGSAQNTCKKTLNRKIVILYHFHFIISVFTIVLCFLKVWLIWKKIK